MRSEKLNKESESIENIDRSVHQIQHSTATNLVFESNKILNKKIVLLNLDIANSNKVMSFIIDTGADISVIKQNKIDPLTFCYPRIKYRATGITTEAIETKAMVVGNLLFKNDKKCSHNFHIVSADLPISTDGLLGNDFLSLYSCRIDYGSNELNIPVNLQNSFDESENNCSKIQCSSLVKILPRTECSIVVDVPYENKEILCFSTELKPGIYLANSIVKCQNYSAILGVINTTNQIYYFNSKDINYKKTFDVLNNYNILVQMEMQLTMRSDRINLENEKT